MPYISKESVKEKRNQIKKAFPASAGWKIKVRTRHYSVIDIHITQAPIKLIDNDYQQLNTFQIESRFKHNPEAQLALSKIYDIANKTNEIESVDGDYGNIPSFYVHMAVGEWDNPFKYVNLIQS